MRQWQFQQLIHEPRTVVVTKGKHKGLVAPAIRRSHYGSEVIIPTDPQDKEQGWNGTDLRIPYKNVEWVKHDGVTPDPRGMVDMTGRDIEIGTWVVYSISAGRASHGLEIGKVTSISDTGVLTCERSLRNGEKATPGWRNNNTRRVNDADRCLTLPVDETTMVTWVLKDFSDLKED